VLDGRRTRRGTRPVAPPVVVVLAIIVVLIALIPLGFVVASTVTTSGGEIRRLLLRPRVGELLGNTVRLVVGGVLVSALLGAGAAWLVERTDLPGRRVWATVLVAPLAVPAFVNSYGWVSLTSAVEGFGGAVLICSMSYYPLVFLPVAAALRGLDPALEDTASALGLSRFAVLVRVVLPQLRPALLGGSLLVGLHLLAEFGALQMLRFPTFTTAVYDQYRSSFNGPAATMLAGVLVLLCLVLLVGEQTARGRRRLARVGSGARRESTRVRLGPWAIPAVLGLVGLAVLALGVPVGSLAHWLVTGSSTAFPAASLATATLTSLGLGAVAAVVTVVAALPVAYLAVRFPRLASTLLERGTYTANALPGIVVALALVTVAIRFAQPIYQSTLLLVVAYAIMFLPRGVVSARAALAQAPPLLDDVSASLGVGPVRTFVRVTLPLIAPGLASGAALVFIAAGTELTATLLLSPIGTTTLATSFWGSSSSLAYGAAAPYAALMIALSMPATFLLTRQARRTAAP
jgi:iron(III) transport system permease protein